MKTDNNTDNLDRNLDSLGVKKSLDRFTDQILNSYRQSLSFEVKNIRTFENIVISGMGGSSNAAKILQGLIEKESDKQVFVFNDYGLPSWINKNSLVILNSYSGNTEETLSALADARLKDCQVIAISTSGKLSRMVEQGELYGLTIDPKDTNPTSFPKTGLGVSLGLLIGVLSLLKVLNLNDLDLEDVLKGLKSIKESWDVDSVLSFLHGFSPVLLSGRPFVGAINAARNAICEIGRTFTEFYDFPELDHVLIEATQKPEIAKSKRYIFFESNYNHERVILRYKITKQIFDEQGLKYVSLPLKSASKLGQALEIVWFSAYIGYGLSIMDNDDPGPEPWILKLKDSLSQPVH